MKVLFPLMLTLTVLIQSISGSILVLKYEIQKNYIAKKLCENKNKPGSGCAGKCYLKKLLKQNEEAEAALPGSIKEKMEVAYLCEIPFEISYLNITPQVVRNYHYHYFLPETTALIAFQPPQFILV